MAIKSSEISPEAHFTTPTSEKKTCIPLNGLIYKGSRINFALRKPNLNSIYNPWTNQFLFREGAESMRTCLCNTVILLLVCNDVDMICLCNALNTKLFSLIAFPWDYYSIM